MPLFGDDMRKHAFKTIHTFESYDAFEAEMVTFGETLAHLSPSAVDDCRKTAKWAWDRKATIVPYDEFVPSTKTTVGELRESKQAWAKRWALMRKDFLDGKLLDVLVQPVPGGSGYWWECPVCGQLGSEVKSEKLAHTAGRGHMQTHVTAEDEDELERMKVLNMPVHLLTPYQRDKRAELERDA